MAVNIMENPVEIIRVPFHVASGYRNDTNSKFVPAEDWRLLFRKAGIKILQSVGSVCAEEIVTEWLGSEAGDDSTPPPVIFKDSELLTGTWMGDAYHEAYTSLFLHVRGCRDMEAIFGFLLILHREMKRGYMTLGKDTDVGFGIFENGGPMIFSGPVDRNEYIKAFADYVRKRGVKVVEDAGENELLTGYISYTLKSESRLFIPNPTGNRAYPALLTKLGMEDGEAFDFYSHYDLSRRRRDNAPCPKPIVPGRAVKGMFREYYGILSQMCMNYEVSDEDQSEIEVIRELLESNGKCGEREAAIRFADMEVSPDRERLHQYFEPLLTMPRDGKLRIIRPLAEGVIFHGKIYFHNLTEKEIDRFLWLFQDGVHTKCPTMHYELGEEREKGFGKVRIRLGGVRSHKYAWEDGTLLWKVRDIRKEKGVLPRNQARKELHKMTEFYLGEARKIDWLDPAADFVPGRLYKARVKGVSSTGKTIEIMVGERKGSISRKIWADFSYQTVPKGSEIDVIFQWDYVRKDGSTGYCFRQYEA